MKLHDLVDNVEDLWESLNYRAPHSDWKLVGDRLERELNVDGDEIVVSLEPKIFTFNGQAIDFINISFEGLKNGVRTAQLTGKLLNGSKVIGAVTNAIVDELTNYDYSALTFISFDHVERRSSIYARIVRNNLHKFGTSYRTDVKMTNGGRAIIVFRASSATWIQPFTEWLANQEKI